MVSLSRKFLLTNLPKCSPSCACAQEAVLLQPPSLLASARRSYAEITLNNTLNRAEKFSVIRRRVLR